MSNGGLKGMKRIINGSCKDSMKFFLRSWKKEYLYYIRMEFRKLLLGITWKIENILNKLVHLAKISTQLQVPTGFLLLYTMRYGKIEIS